MKLTEHHFEDLSRIQYRIYTAQLASLEHSRILIVHFSGVYGYGSSGNQDAAFMRAITRAALSAWSASGLILDLTDLQYEWGDLMASVLECAENELVDARFPIRIVVSDRCRKGITSLLYDEMMNDPSDWVSESMEEALSSIEDSINDLNSRGELPQANSE